jgi:glyoxalase-like protein
MDLSKVDHLIFGTRDLQLGIETIENLVGVRATPGGQHPGGGTRNALLSLGATSYLEILAPDPEQPNPENPRWFALDELAVPKLVGWAATGNDLSQFAARVLTKGIRLGEVSSGSRRNPQGLLLSWQFTNPRTRIADGIVPFFIDWGETPHPARAAASGALLVDLRAEHPDAGNVERILRGLGIDLPVKNGPNPTLIATIVGSHGRVELR